MSTTFTQNVTDSIWSVSCSADDSTIVSVNILEKLRDPKYSRPFSEGLTKLIYKYSYNGSNDPVDKTSFLYEKLSSINVTIPKPTINGWFSNNRRPSLKSDSRNKMFQICFALSVSLEDVYWFFQDIYFDRCFNCHTIDEAVYYYCFKNKLNYSHANNLLKHIKEINTLSLSAPPTEHIYTKEIQDWLDHCSTDDEVISFFTDHINLFNHWNQTAAKHMKEYLSKMKGTSFDKNILDLCKKGKNIRDKDIRECSLIIQELVKYNQLEYTLGKDITSTDFMLDCIFDTPARIDKNVDLPDIIRRNFPSKKVFSDLLKNIENSTSYDSIKKCLVFLKFYTFWCKVDLGLLSIKAVDLYNSYKDETDDLLTDCGYEKLSIHNLYDLFFLYISSCDRPLDVFREVIAKLTSLNDVQ